MDTINIQYHKRKIGELILGSFGERYTNDCYAEGESITDYTSVECSN